MGAGSWVLLFTAGVVVSLSASWLLVSRLERLGERAGFSEAWLGLVAALAADAPEITSAATALSRGQSGVGTGVVTGSNVFNLAALLGVAAVVAGRIGFHRRVVLLAGIPAVWIAAVCVLTVAAVVAPPAGLALGAAVLLPGIAVLGMRRVQMERLPLPARWIRWLIAAVHEEETELAEAIRPRRGTWRDALAGAAALAVVVAASISMEQAATVLGRRWQVADIVTGGLVLAVVTSLPNAVSAVYLARRGRGAAVLSTALNSNAINVAAGLLIPASLTGLGPRTGEDMLAAAWYAGLTMLALAFAFRHGGFGRLPGAVIIAGYLTFTASLAISVAQGGVRPATAVLPAAAVGAGGSVLLGWPARWRPLRAGSPAGQRGAAGESMVPGWTVARISALSLILCLVVAACDAATGPHLILIGLLIAGPCCALLTGRWAPTAMASCLAVALAVVLGVPDQIFATFTQYAFLAAVAVVGLTATVSAAVLQRLRPDTNTRTLRAASARPSRSPAITHRTAPQHRSRQGCGRSSVSFVTVNAEQAEDWNGASGQEFIEQRERHERMLGRLRARLLAAAQIHDGENVLDVGCGCGEMTILAARATRSGHALGADFSRIQVAEARRLAAAAGVANARFEVADAQVHPFGAESFDVVLSSLGVMFFEDPAAAFANLRKSLGRGGRLAFLCWRTREENPVFSTGFAEAAAVLGLRDKPGPPAAFSLADTSQVGELLSSARFGSIEFAQADEPMLIGLDVDDVLEYERASPTATEILTGLSPAQAAELTRQVRDSLVAYASPDGVTMPGAAWLVTAQAL